MEDCLLARARREIPPTPSREILRERCRRRTSRALLQGGLADRFVSREGSINSDPRRDSMSGIRRHLTYANVMATLAVFIALGGTALASVIVSKNSQVASGTISGHKPPSGDHPNVIAGSINGTD